MNVYRHKGLRVVKGKNGGGDASVESLGEWSAGSTRPAARRLEEESRNEDRRQRESAPASPPPSATH